MQYNITTIITKHEFYAQLPSHVWLFVTPWTVAHQAPLSMGYLRQEYWSQLPFPSPGDLPDPVIEPESPTLAGRFFTLSHMASPYFIPWLEVYTFWPSSPISSFPRPLAITNLFCFYDLVFFVGSKHKWIHTYLALSLSLSLSLSLCLSYLT